MDHESQKPIVVGKGGDMVKRIGTEARQDLEEMLQGRVFLDLHVKVREGWRDDERLLRELGLNDSRIDDLRFEIEDSSLNRELLIRD